MSQFSIPPVDLAMRDAPSRFSELTSEDFVRIIFTELTNQDPLAPNDSSALLEQMNSIRSIESDIRLMERLESLVTQSELAAAANLIGKFVEGMAAGANRVSGTVVSVFREGDNVSLELDSGWRVPMDQVTTIHDLAPPSDLR